MQNHPDLPSSLVSLLKYEAYAILCQESLTEAVAEIRREKKEILSTRPPFGVLASKETRQVFEKSLRAATLSEVGLRNRIDQLSQIDVWIKSEIEQGLQAYLPGASIQYRSCLEAAVAVGQWEEAASALHEISQALARDARAVLGALNPIPVPNQPPPSPSAQEQARIRTLGNLRITVVALQVGVDEARQIRTRFAELCSTTADGLELPLLPGFRTDAWVDLVAILPPQKAIAELVECETEARDFHAKGLKALLLQAVEIREACLEAAKIILAQNWRTLRAEAVSAIADEREVDEVIAELSRIRIESELNRRQTTFEAAKIAKLF